ncbi:hypothetical protein RRG08_050498 [Elysia crispata]|uniref:DRBM domain-containing protein n=1 Tax=Elysia crispata TaxID=231223 RepID=A0AAE0XSN5_9GAST|nr:hypothetical protein RRG08_050498 [Elysia crispata]
MLPSQRFIPGLNSRPDDLEMPPKPPEKTDFDYLIEDFTSKKKNPAMCLHEYCQKQKLSLKFKEDEVQFRPGQPQTFGNYGCSAIIEDKQYPQGVASNKKKAKIEASRLCIRVLAGWDDFVPVDILPDIDDNRYVEVRDLLDICAEKNILYEKMMNKDQSGVHTCTIHLTNQDPIKYSSADREEAVIRAHAEAIKILQGYASTNESLDTFVDNNAVAEPPRVPDPAAAQLREQEAYAALDRTLQTLPPEIASYDHNIAAIFLSNKNLQEFKGIGKIVAFGTGNSTIEEKYLTQDGRCVVDSTAATMARRSFKRFIGSEMVNCLSGANSIFEKSFIIPGRLKLKVGFEFHLFLSHPPEGDYKQPEPSSFSPEELADIARGAHFPTFTNDSHGIFMCHDNQGEIKPSAVIQDDMKASRSVWVMSPSDKLLSWNILGLQGAVYSHFIEPIYLKEICLGYNKNNDHGHLCRAVCCRVYPELETSFPPPYRINHPALSFSPTPEVRELCHPGTDRSPYSTNWSVHDSKTELTDCHTGRSNIASPFQVSANLVSRQCKAGLHLKWFRDISKLSPLVPGDKSPAEIKVMAQDYQTVKAEFFQHCLENSIGKWVHIPQE